MPLTPEQFERYRHQLGLPGMGEAAQARLLSKKALVAGVRTWGANAIRYLSEAGLGNITVFDSDADAVSRVQEWFETERNRLDTKLEVQPQEFETAQLENLFRDADVIVDGLDNWQHKLAVSDMCMQMKKPLVHAGGAGSRFQIYTMLPKRSACLRCVFMEIGMDDVPLLPTVTATFAPVHGMVGAMQAIETVKIIADIGVSQGNELFKFDWLSGEFETVRGLDPRSDCPDCGRHARGQHN